MGFWSWIKGGIAAGEKPNLNPPSTPDSVGPGYHPGDPHGVTDETVIPTYSRSLPILQPSPWSGWPAEWGTPDWRAGIEKLVDTAWDCIDLNASILSSMPVYLLSGGTVVPGPSWMTNPNPDVYTSWAEFMKQLLWDYQSPGEAFVLATDWYATGWPSRFLVIPKHFVRVEMAGLRRRYFIGKVELNTDPLRQELLHIRYKSYVDQPHGVGPLDAAGARLTAAGVLQRQIEEVARAGGVPPYVLHVKRRLRGAEADEVLDQWDESRARHRGSPALVSGDTEATQMQIPSAKDMALVELAEFTDGRICVKLGVPPFLMGLPGGGDSLVYANVSQLFDYHDRASLSTKATHVMQALSGWALPRSQSAELNRDEYSRPELPERAAAYANLAKVPGAISGEDVRAMERFHGPAAASQITGGNQGE